MIEFLVNIRTQSESNLREHWAAKAKRVKQHRWAVAFRFREAMQERLWGRFTGVLTWLAWTVTLTRIAPRELDDDNLRSALKAIRDSIATELGFDKKDNDRRLTWQYAQEKGKPKTYAVRIRIEPRTQEQVA